MSADRWWAVWLFSGFMPGPLFAIHLPKTWLDRYFAFNRIRGVKNTRNFQRMPKSCFVLRVIINQFLCNKEHVQLYRNAWQMAQCISEFLYSHVLSFLHLSNPLSMKQGAVKRTTVYRSSYLFQPKHIPCLNEDRVQSSGDAGLLYHTNQSYCPDSASLF